MAEVVLETFKGFGTYGREVGSNRLFVLPLRPAVCASEKGPPTGCAWFVKVLAVALGPMPMPVVGWVTVLLLLKGLELT